MIKIALIGDGKTGSHVQTIVAQNPSQFELVGPFNLHKNLQDQQNMDELTQSDVAISFVPGTAVVNLVQLILKNPKAIQIPFIWGSTGVDWNPQTSSWAKQLHEELIQKKVTWIYASNFALGMNLVRQILSLVSTKLSELPPPLKLSLHEIHHVHKKDAPSGTALTWQKWIDPQQTFPMVITSQREGDVVGIHELQIETENEVITICHRAKDRSLFATGALEAAKKVILHRGTLPFGLLPFENLLQVITNTKEQK